MFRTPTTSSEENASFYQQTYTQGFTTNLPDDKQLEDLKTNKFANSDKDYSQYIDVLKALGVKAGDRLLDFGCSWGYGSWQFQENGFDVTSYEISKPRCQYAREKLSVDAVDKLEDLPDEKFDVFFSAHVLEHVPSIADVFELAKSKLKDTGIFVAFTPNGSEAYRGCKPDAWMKLWGMVHPNFLDDQFYRKAFPNSLLASDPYDLQQIEQAWSQERTTPLSLEGVELLVAFQF